MIIIGVFSIITFLIYMLYVVWWVYFTPQPVLLISPFLPPSFLFSFLLNNSSLLSFNTHIHDFNSSYIVMKHQLRNEHNTPTNESLKVLMDFYKNRAHVFLYRVYIHKTNHSIFLKFIISESMSSNSWINLKSAAKRIFKSYPNMTGCFKTPLEGSSPCLVSFKMHLFSD